MQDTMKKEIPNTKEKLPAANPPIDLDDFSQVDPRDRWRDSVEWEIYDARTRE